MPNRDRPSLLPVAFHRIDPGGREPFGALHQEGPSSIADDPLGNVWYEKKVLVIVESKRNLGIVLPEDLVGWLDAQRGPVPRSVFIEGVLESVRSYLTKKQTDSGRTKA